MTAYNESWDTLLRYFYQPIKQSNTLLFSQNNSAGPARPPGPSPQEGVDCRRAGFRLKPRSKTSPVRRRRRNWRAEFSSSFYLLFFMFYHSLSFMFPLSFSIFWICLIHQIKNKKIAANCEVKNFLDMIKLTCIYLVTRSPGRECSAWMF